MIPDLKTYCSLVFDCDGVVLNSNRVKTEAFRIAALPYGAAAAESLVQYHLRNGGISRYAKFSQFLEKTVAGMNGPGYDALLASYAEAVLDGLMSCEVAPGLDTLRDQTPDARWMIVSGGDQAELREVFATRGLDHFFDSGIHGSPDPKDTILTRLRDDGTIKYPGLFFGDSVYDFQVSVPAGLDFVFLHGWSDVNDWRTFVKANSIPATTAIGDFV